MTVLLSIKPEFAFKIFNGSKRYEYRRAIFSKREVTKVVVYASHPVKRVIGEFEIGSILYDELQSLWARTKRYAGINKTMFFYYFKDQAKGYAIKIKSTRAYEDPLLLSSFMLSSPPQSFRYLKKQFFGSSFSQI
jgi:predicted transcriptional regulator